MKDKVFKDGPNILIYFHWFYSLGIVVLLLLNLNVNPIGFSIIIAILIMILLLNRTDFLELQSDKLIIKRRLGLFIPIKTETICFKDIDQVEIEKCSIGLEGHGASILDIDLSYGNWILGVILGYLYYQPRAVFHVKFNDKGIDSKSINVNSDKSRIDLLFKRLKGRVDYHFT